MRRTAILVAALLSTGLITAATSTQTNAQEKSKRGADSASRKAAAPEKTGLAVGEKAPAIRLKDQAGKERTLEETLHDGTVAIVFHRSAGW